MGANHRFVLRDARGAIHHNPERELLTDLMCCRGWPTCTAQPAIENYVIGYLLHPYVSFYSGRGCPAQCTFCLWPQTIGGQRYRVRSAQNVAEEMGYKKRLFLKLKSSFSMTITFTANLPRAREIARRIAPLGLTGAATAARIWTKTPCVSSRIMDCGSSGWLRKRNAKILENIKKVFHWKRCVGSRARVTNPACACRGLHPGPSGETRHSIEETVRFARTSTCLASSRPRGPYPGTELYEQAVERVVRQSVAPDRCAKTASRNPPWSIPN